MSSSSSLYRPPCTSHTSCTHCHKTWAVTNTIFICNQCPREEHVLCSACKNNTEASLWHTFREGKCKKSNRKWKKKRPSFECGCGSINAWQPNHVCQGRIDPGSRLNLWTQKETLVKTK